MRSFLGECGMNAARRVSLTFSRGAAVVEVLATEIVNGIALATIRECKNWKTNSRNALI